MNSRALKSFRQKLAEGQPTYGLWISLESASLTELAVALGVDWVVVDAEHGSLDWKEIAEHIRAAVRSATVVLVRIAERNACLAKRTLDIGADGIVVPWIETVEQLEEAVRDCRYPPQGRRGIGGERATVWGQCLVEHTAEANEQVLVVPIIESVKAVAAVPAMCRVDGAEVFFFGPADFSASAGYRGQWEGPGVAEQILQLKETIRHAGKHCGLLATSTENLLARREQGFRMLGLGADTGLLLRSLHEALKAVGRDRRPATSLDPADGQAIHAALPIPKASMRLAQAEVITASGQRPAADLQPGISLAARGGSGSQRSPFRVALTADFYDEAGHPKFADLGLSVFDGQSHIAVSNFASHQPVIQPDQISGAHGVVVLTPQVTRASIAGCPDLLAIGRFGVGYDSVDVGACTESKVLAMITAGAVDRPVAEATIAWMLALTHHVLAKDRLVRTGRWNDRTRYMGCELRDRTLGVIGLGGIGRQLVSLLQGFGMRQPIAFDPFVPPEAIEGLGVRAATLDDLLSTADFVSIHCPLNQGTRGLIGARELGLMKRDAYLLNTARGGIVDEDALFEALQSHRIAGAALDCFASEPVTAPMRFGELENVLLAPHSIAWTGELFRDIGRTACQSMVDLSLGRRPHGVLNPELFSQPAFLEKWARLIGLANPQSLKL